ncbi:MAG: bifunctional 3-deoxy-7-phosphoheptulonate synthase/chorismate mutase type II [Paludibacter sp.]|nr:bifunctional 3-deoxy-7-phosphoheptulonate synthase/chorismate mutase type II [Bacteroidales bacterium]MCM1068965.1 bifunctional 3-deoxy-7-phosphoheptulonate synthase/chorismate mutase type II [Prevotella sp.]MCM1353628.1 bifunctional 3-deoxy-7-phosphoheptulonate synthase/chorismate mutase type II [Bacteroides sp.]MCM1442023.1 bifunctional 3-deoxy-7-phosphoheptulonate synthase/chorismate mutase type II [Muribaculum sp.]MCM1481521.1 bifunctional 3-deoxy-7-phosphoheptulonate synthase/chorismate
MNVQAHNHFSQRPLYIAGPCSAETEDQVLCVAHALHQAGIGIFRAGLWKPRTHPDAFDGVGEKGIAWLNKVQHSTGMAVATEVATAEHVRICCNAHIDALWIGARTTGNPFMMQQIANELSHYPATDQPVIMVKNPISPDLDLWLGAIERLQQVGIQHIIAIHRGFSTTASAPLRNQPIWSIPIELHKRMPHILLLCDPSHITGKAEWVATVAQQAICLNFDGLMIEAHCDPAQARSDAMQQITPQELQTMLSNLQFRQQNKVDAELLTLRQQIDETDEQIWQLIRQRMDIARQIGQYKAQHNMPVLQNKRFEQVLQKRINWALENGISEETAKQIMHLIHEESVRMQMPDIPPHKIG